ncbi:hypothetical protein D3C73_1339950 [compost metagenome]
MIKHIYPKIGNRSPYEAVGPHSGMPLIQLLIANMNRRFRNAIHVHQLGRIISVTLIPVLQPPKLQCFTAKNHISEQKRLAQLDIFTIRLHELIKSRRSLVQYGYSLFREQLEKFYR